MRLSYHQRISEIIPDTMKALLPAPSKPLYKYETEESANLDGTAIAHQLLEKIKQRCLPEDIVQLVREIPDNEIMIKHENGEMTTENNEDETTHCNPLKIEVFTSTLLYFGSKSFSHIFAALAKYVDAWEFLKTIIHF